MNTMRKVWVRISCSMMVLAVSGATLPVNAGYDFVKSPFHIELNQGQIDASVKYLTRMADHYSDRIIQWFSEIFTMNNLSSCSQGKREGGIIDD